MRVLGITAEYNPFHNGHGYHLEQSRKQTGADCVAVVMSGNFTQRGEPAILDKWTRSRIAVENGADLVLELPFVCACNRAEYFASGAVDILQGIGADWISFGSESGDLAALTSLAEELWERRASVAAQRCRIMKDGFSFAKANQLAVGQILGKAQAALLLTPNNILALEYLKRISFWKGQGHAIEPITVKRHGAGYFEADETLGFAGATAIRQMHMREEYSRYVPENTADALERALKDAERRGKDCTASQQAEERFFQLLQGELIKSSREDLAEIYCMGEGLENKLKKEIVRAEDMKGLISAIVSKRYTEAAVRRLLVYVLLRMREKEPEWKPYARVLAAGEKGRLLLKQIKAGERGTLPVITNLNKEWEACRAVHDTLRYDLLASDMYHLLLDSDLYANSDRVKAPYIR